MYSQIDLNDKDFAAYMEKSSKIEVSEVEIDGLAILKLVNHCAEKNSVVTGELVGLCYEGTLQVTNCFPILENTEKRMNSLI